MLANEQLSNMAKREDNEYRFTIKQQKQKFKSGSGNKIKSESGNNSKTLGH